ncbi:acetylxylan esterase [Echinicola soli]|uniref:Acetylxylan esterase n=1 Tax=Echinicola soli TaxID=2591634 RepID=A0A514CFS4_9BACT|nr:CocE/NonD family hydrolase [Echinicola soli]QDH78524.1 acetylxylan esterase [Echinicola soli]
MTTLFLFSGLTDLYAQDADQNYRATLEETLDRIETTFQVTLQYDQKLLGDKVLDYAFWRIRPGNLENSLTAVLSPFDLTYYQEGAKTYSIKPFQYHKKSISFAQEELAYFESLYDNRIAWEDRKSQLRQCMIEALGILELPRGPSSEPVITKRRNHKGYSVENVALEVLPGIYTTGSVYRPRPLKKNLPIIIMPNGHFGEGRYRESEQIRAATLAKMGAVVVGYDLFAWGESQLQFASEDHRLSAAHTIQTWNGIQWIDYLSALAETDPERVGITGGSGGGSQTMLLTAVDDRISVSVPTVMVSSHFSGGCPCESGKPIHLCGGGTNNAEIAAMAAPRPLLIISDGGDWTHTVPELEFPFIQRTYGFYGAENKVANAHFPEEGHDYKYSKRQAMYPFMAEHLGLHIDKLKNDEGKVDESGVVIEEEQTLKVFGQNGEDLPESAIKGKDALFNVLE